MQRVVVSLRISADKMLSVYRGGARTVWTKTSDGRTIEFPADLLRKFVSEDGVYGSFEICFDGQNRLISMRRFDPDAKIDRLV